MKKILVVLILLFLIISTLGCDEDTLGSNQGKKDNDTQSGVVKNDDQDAPDVDASVIDAALDLSKMDEKTMQETITPHLEAYALIISGDGIYRPLIETSDESFRGYTNEADEVFISGLGEAVPEGYAQFDTYYFASEILNYSSAKALEDDFRDWALQYLDKDFVDIEKEIEDAYPILHEQNGRLFYVSGMRGYWWHGANPESCALIDFDNGKYTVYTAFYFREDGAITRYHCNLLFEVKDGKLLLTGAEPLDEFNSFGYYYPNWDMQDMLEPHLKAYATLKSSFNYSVMVGETKRSDLRVFRSANGDFVVANYDEGYPTGMDSYEYIYSYPYLISNYTSANQLRKDYCEWLSEWIDFESASFKPLYDDLNTQKDYSVPTDNLWEHEGKLYEAERNTSYAYDGLNGQLSFKVRYLKETAELTNILHTDEGDKYVITVKYETDDKRTGYTEFTFFVKRGKLLIVDSKDK